MLNFKSSDAEREFGIYRTIGLSDGTLEVLQAMREYEKIIPRATEVDPALYADQRNLLQYNLLSLPSTDTTRDIHWKDAIYESCRLALIIYSMGVTFPMTLTAGPWRRFITELYTVLRANHSKLLVEESYHPIAFRLLRWIVTVGGIAAYGTSYRTYFVLLLSSLSPDTTLSDSFEDFKTRDLKKILWLESACDAAGERMWEEMCLCVRPA
jgi:hypothetical protein